MRYRIHIYFVLPLAVFLNKIGYKSCRSTKILIQIEVLHYWKVLFLSVRKTILILQYSYKNCSSKGIFPVIMLRLWVQKERDGLYHICTRKIWKDGKYGFVLVWIRLKRSSLNLNDKSLRSGFVDRLRGVFCTSFIFLVFLLVFFLKFFDSSLVLLIE